MTDEQVGGSFRDPSGFVFSSQGTVYRQVNQRYSRNYELLMGSGLYEELTRSGLLISHEEVQDAGSPNPGPAYRVLRPRQLPFISYPYEWSFSQLKDAALATLSVQRTALRFGMTLKDATAYNIQFVDGAPVMIDTLSFEEYVEGTPWTPYKQFCQHFLAPLALMSCVDVRLSGLLRNHIDGIPLDLAARMLPLRTRMSPQLALHIHLHAGSQKRYSDKPIGSEKFGRSVSRNALMGLIDSLESSVKKLKWEPAGTEWADYYDDDSYTPSAMEHKQQLVREYVNTASPRSLWDLGANNGCFSRIAATQGAEVVSLDFDPACVEQNYRQCVKSGEKSILPLVMDLSNPSPGIGWNNRERQSIVERGPVDAVMALALIHHLAISNNVPLDMISEFAGQLCTWLIVEFVPKSDHKVQRLLATREDVFDDYTIEGFERAFSKRFDISRSDAIKDSERVLFLMRRHGP